LTQIEETKGIEVSLDQKFTVRVSRPHHQTVVQALVVTTNSPDPTLPPSSAPTCQFDGAKDFGSEFASQLASDNAAGNDGRLTFQFMAWVTVFRDGDGPRTAAKNPPFNSFFMNLLSFQGANLLANGGSGFGRFNGTITQNVPGIGQSTGRIFCALATDASIPQLAAVYVPNSVDLTQEVPIPVHVFFCPTTGAKTKPYPFSFAPPGAPKDDSFNGVVDGFLTGFTRRLINQHVAGNKRCILIFPLPPPSGYFDGIKDAERLRRYCLEVLFFVQKTVGNLRVPLPKLGHCALSAFSSAGVPLHSVVSSSATGAFPELQEVYGIDVVSPAGSSTDATSYQLLFRALNAWLRQDPRRRIRLYSQSPAMNSVVDPLVKGPVLQNNAGGAAERGTSNTTFAFLPVSFWQVVDSEQLNKTVPDPNYLIARPGPPRVVDFNSVHQVFPAIVLEHALVNSGFA